MLIAKQEYSRIIDINTGDSVWALRFTANDEYLVSGGNASVRVWRVKDGSPVTTLRTKQGPPLKNVECVAVSKDGKFIAAGSIDCDVVVWNATTYKDVFAGKVTGSTSTIQDVDFSPDSTRLISANGDNNTATVWDIAAGKKVHTLSLSHDQSVLAAKYSPQGDRIATATRRSVRVWDSNDGQLLVDVEVGLSPRQGLLWFNSHLYVKTNDSKIRQIDASTGSTISEWSVPSANSCIALPLHGQFIAYATKDNVTLWDTSTHTQHGLILHKSIRPSITFSPNDRLLAIVSQERRVVIKALSLVEVRPCTNKFPFLICTPYTRNWKFGLKTLRLMRGNTVGWRRRRSY